MQGKSRSMITSRSRATLAIRSRSAPMSGASCATGLLECQGPELRMMDEAGVELMIASLNAPAIPAVTDVSKPSRWAPGETIFSRKRWRSAPTVLAGVAARAMQDPDAAMRSSSVGSSSSLSARWSTGYSQRSGIRQADPLRPAASIGSLARGRAPRRAFI